MIDEGQSLAKHELPKELADKPPARACKAMALECPRAGAVPALPQFAKFASLRQARTRFHWLPGPRCVRTRGILHCLDVATFPDGRIATLSLDCNRNRKIGAPVVRSLHGGG
jgi:hypothetical protein